MKKVLLSLGLVAGLSGAAQAQGIKFGAKAGASLTNITGSDVSDNSYKFGFHGGVLANFGINDMFSIQPEALYSMKGAKSSGSGDDSRINLNYVDVPVLVKVATGATGLFFEAGPQVGFLVSANLKDNSSSVDAKELFKSVDFGYAAGLGFQTESGAMVGLRYNGAFTNNFKPISLFGQTAEPNAKNSAFQLYVGYMFGGK